MVKCTGGSIFLKRDQRGTVQVTPEEGREPRGHSGSVNTNSCAATEMIVTVTAVTLPGVCACTRYMCPHVYVLNIIYTHVHTWASRQEDVYIIEKVYSKVILRQ